MNYTASDCEVKLNAFNFNAGNSIGGYLPFLDPEDILEFAAKTFNAGSDIHLQK